MTTGRPTRYGSAEISNYIVDAQSVAGDSDNQTIKKAGGAPAIICL